MIGTMIFLLINWICVWKIYLLNFFLRAKIEKILCYNVLAESAKGSELMENVGLVLEGGGMRGFYTAGVLDFFIEQNFYTNGVIGVSAGACHACSYVSKQRKRSYRINTKYLKDKRYMSFHSLIKTGDLFGAEFVYDTIPNELEPFDYETYHSSGIKMYAVCSNLETGKAEYLPCINMKHDVIYVRASASLPLLSRIVEVNGLKLLDGGCTDSIPVKKFQELGYKKNIIIVTQCKEYRKGKNNLLPIIRKTYRNYPNFIKAMEQRHIEYNRTLDEIDAMEKEDSVYVIRPKEPVTIGRLEKNVDKLTALYDQGYQDAKEQFQHILQFVNS